HNEEGGCCDRGGQNDVWTRLARFAITPNSLLFFRLMKPPLLPPATTMNQGQQWNSNGRNVCTRLEAVMLVPEGCCGRARTLSATVMSSRLDKLFEISREAATHRK